MNADSKLVDVRFPAFADRLRMVRSVVQAAAEQSGYTAGETESIVLAVNEACMNVIQHAYGDGHEDEIHLEIMNNGDELVFRLTDFSRPVDISKIRPRKLDEIRPGGLGTHFINEVMDEVDYSPLENGSGNRLVMKKKLNR